MWADASIFKTWLCFGFGFLTWDDAGVPTSCSTQCCSIPTVLFDYDPE